MDLQLFLEVLLPAELDHFFHMQLLSKMPSLLIEFLVFILSNTFIQSFRDRYWFGGEFVLQITILFLISVAI